MSGLTAIGENKGRERTGYIIEIRPDEFNICFLTLSEIAMDSSMGYGNAGGCATLSSATRFYATTTGTRFQEECTTDKTGYSS
jgi:hypothetical protein